MKREKSARGRKAKHGPTSSLTLRIPNDLRGPLQVEASAEGVSLADRMNFHLRNSMNYQAARRRDPALAELFDLIAALADNLNAIAVERSWRNDPLAFAAFRLSVSKLLQAIPAPEKPAKDDASV